MKGLPGKFGRPRATERISISVSITFIILVKGLAVATRENGCAAKRANHVRKIFGIVDLLPPCHCPIHCTWHSYKLQGSAKRLWSSWENAWRQARAEVVSNSSIKIHQTCSKPFSRALYQYHCLLLGVITPSPLSLDVIYGCPRIPFHS